MDFPQTLVVDQCIWVARPCVCASDPAISPLFWVVSPGLAIAQALSAHSEMAVAPMMDERSQAFQNGYAGALLSLLLYHLVLVE